MTWTPTPKMREAVIEQVRADVQSPADYPMDGWSEWKLEDIAESALAALAPHIAAAIDAARREEREKAARVIEAQGSRANRWIVRADAAAAIRARGQE